MQGYNEQCGVWDPAFGTSTKQNPCIAIRDRCGKHLHLLLLSHLCSTITKAWEKARTGEFCSAVPSLSSIPVSTSSVKQHQSRALLGEYKCSGARLFKPVNPLTDNSSGKNFLLLTVENFTWLKEKKNPSKLNLESAEAHQECSRLWQQCWFRFLNCRQSQFSLCVRDHPGAAASTLPQHFSKGFWIPSVAPV